MARLPRKPKTKSQDTGTDVHKQLEHYLKTGENVLGPIAREGRPYLPAPGLDLMLEWPIHFEPEADTDPADPRRNEPRLTICGIPMIGYIDLVNPRSLPGSVEVTDHKTTSSIESYSKTAEQLVTDAQCVSYCEWARLRFPSARQFRFSHLYYQTRGRNRALPVSCTHTPASLLEAWHLTETKVERMRAAARESDPANVAHNPDACDAYGGCDYAGSCPRSPQRRFAQSFSAALKKGSSTTMSLADRLKSKSTAPAPASAPAAAPPPPPPPAPVAAAPTPPPAAPPAPPASAPAAESSEGVKVTECVPGHTYLLPACAGIEGRAQDVVSNFAGKAGTWGLFRDEAKNLTRARLDEVVIPIDASDAPAEAPSAPVVAAAAPAAPTASILPPDAPKSDPAKASVPQASPAPAAAPAAPATPAAEAPKRRGRPPKTAGQPSVDAGLATAPAPASTNPPPVAEPGELVLYVNAIPSGGALDLTAYVHKIAGEVAKLASVEDVRIADGQSPLGFGKWAGFLAQHARDNPPAGRCVIFSSQLADPIIEALASVAIEVVRGVR